MIWRTINPHRIDDAPLYLHALGAVTWERHSTTLEPGAQVSYGTYFGAFPSGYWNQSTAVKAVEILFETDAEVDASVYGTDGNGDAHLLTMALGVSGAIRLYVEFSDLTSGWIWPEFRSHDEPVTIRDVRWRTSKPAVRGSSVTVAITTFDREADCSALLQSIAAPELTEFVTRVVVADQGSRSLQSAAAFEPVARALGDRLQVIRQANLGGSGGFSRGMLAAASGADEFVLLLDDDVRLEPESIARIAAFAAHCVRPTIIGAQMLSLVDPTRLHSFGEKIDRRAMWWSAVDPTLSGIDLTAGIRGTPALSRRIDVDFNGWWMCLVPTATVREIGTSLPYFIKWDDAEFGLRAAAHGVATVTLPGAALWHMPWTAKDDGLDWQAYFQLRNRVLTALLHGGRGVLRSSFAQDLNHLICAQYGSVALRNTALRDILLGPAHLDPVLRAGPRRAAAILDRMGQTIIPFEKVPVMESSEMRQPAGPLAALWRLGQIGLHQLRRPDQGQPILRLTRSQGKWWSLGVTDIAAVDAASATGSFVFRRDRRTAGRELRRAVALRWRLWWGWRGISRRYADDSRASTLRPAWDARFGVSDVIDR